MVSKKASWLIVTGIFLLGLILRTVGLTSYPPALNWDEVSHGFNAYSLLVTGRDQWRTAFPFPNFRAYGDYPTVLNLYATVPFVAVLGPTDFAIRFPHAILGALTCLMLYVLAYRLTPDRYLALFAGLLTAISPWTFFPSRAVFQSNWIVFLLSLSLALFYSRRRLLSLGFFALSLFAYHNTKILVPLIMVYFIIKFRSQKKIVIASIATLLVAVLLLINPQSRARNSWVGILDSGAISYIEQNRNTSQLPGLLTKLIYNRPVYFLSSTLSNYLGYFSPKYLFVSGGTQYQFSVPGFGLLNPVLLPFYYLGLYLLIKKRHDLLLLWILASPIPGAITRDQFAVIRSTTMIPAVLMAVVFGVMSLTKSLGKSFLVFLSAAVIIFSGFYYYYFFHDYSNVYSQDWQYGYRQVTEFVKQNFDEYDRILITKRYGEPHEFILWYWPWDPQKLLSDQSFSSDYHDAWYWVGSFSKFTFINDWEMSDFVRDMTKGGKTLVISSPENTPPGGINLKQINFLNDQPAFIIKEI